MRDIKDGTSNTLAFSERCVANGTRDVKTSIARSLPNSIMDNPTPCLAQVVDGENTSNVATGWSGVRMFDGCPAFTGFTTVLPPNGPTCIRGTWDCEWGIFTPSSYHPGGVLVTLADGSSRFISETIDTGNVAAPSPCSPAAGDWSSCGMESNYGVWGALGSRNGGEAVSMP
jgi:hypothetical protein